MNVPKPELTATNLRKHWQTIAVLICAVSYLILAAFSGSLMPLRIIKGTSMEPTLREGDVVFVRRIPFDSLETGDVIAYKIPSPFTADDFGLPVSVLHRVIDIGNDDGVVRLKTKGDNSEIDPWSVSKAEYTGIMQLRIPWLALPLVFLTSFKGLLFLSLIFLLSLLYFPAVSIFYMVVMKRPKEIQSLVHSDQLGIEDADKTLQLENNIKQLSSTIGEMAEGQKRLNSSISELSGNLTVTRADDESYERLNAVMSRVEDYLQLSAAQQGPISVQQNLSYKVLVVDDQSIYRELLRATLEDSSEFNVVGEAADGVEAMELVNSVSPDLVLMDVNMPNMNGFEAAQRIRESHPDTRVALISGISDKEYRDKSNEVGAAGFLAKDALSINEIRNIASKDIRFSEITGNIKLLM